MSRAGTKMVYHKKTCPVCGRVGRFHTYDTPACKQKAYRMRKQAVMNGVSSTISSYLIEEFGEDKCTAIFNHLNSVTAKSNQAHVNDAIVDIINLFAHKITAERRERK